MKTLYRLFLVAIFAGFGFAQNANASHISGGNVTYECVGQDSFLVTLNLFRDCDGITVGSTQTMSFSSSCGSSFTATLTQQSSSEVSQLCPTQITNSTCNGGTLPGMEHYVYTAIVVMSPACNSWNMSWTSCCRNNLISNLNNPAGLDTYLFAEMYSATEDCNSSPTFTSLPIPYVCLNQVVNYNFGVVESDGDSVVYSLSNPYLTATTFPTYTGTYSFSQPLPGGNAVLNTQNGQLTFTPTATGVFVIAVMVTEYQSGTGLILGRSVRDVQVVVQGCSNSQPVIDSPGMYNFQGSGIQIDSNTIEVCIGNNFSFDVAFSDANISDSLFIFHNIYQALDSTAVVTITPGTSGAPTVVNVQWTAQPGSAAFNPFIITAVDDACPVSGLVSGVFNVIVVPSTYGGPNQTICQGTQWAQFNAVGGSQFQWAALPGGSPIDTVVGSPTYNATCQNCTSPQFSPSVTTSYVVVSNLSSTCNNMDTVTVTVAPNFTLNMPNDTLICSVDDYPLQISTDQPTFSYTYQWSPSSSLDYDTVMVPLANPIDPTTYTVTVESAGGCVKKGNVSIDLSPPFPPNMQITGDTVLCVGQSTQLDIDYGPVPVGSCAPTTQGCVGVNQNGDIGTGSNTNTASTFPCVYGSSVWSSKHQILYRANELQSLGMAAGGFINSIAFYINSLGTPASFGNFEIKMACTSEVDLSGGWISPSALHTVYSSSNYIANAGWNVHNFTNSYKWDGSSSLVIQICYNNPASGTGNAIMPYTSTGFQSVIYSTTNAVGGNACPQLFPIGSGSNLSTKRPNTRFNFCSGVDPAALTYNWSPAAGLSGVNIPNPLASPGTSTTYSVIVSDTFGGCTDTIEHFIDMVTQFDAGFSFNDPYCASDAPDSAIANVGGGYYTGVGVDSSGWFDPALAGVGIHPITYHIPVPTLCANDSTIDVEVISLPDATISYAEVCVGGDTIILSAATPGGTWGGAGIIDPVNGIFDPAGLSAGTYFVNYTLTQPCLSTDTMGVKVIKPYTFSFIANQKTVCQDDSIDVSANYSLSNDPLQGNGPVIATWSDAAGRISADGVFNAMGATPGDYIVTLTVTGMDGTCGSSKTMIIKVLQKDYPQFPNGLVFCDNEDKAVITVAPWLYGNGTSFTQTPIGPLGPNDTLDIVPFGSNGKFDATQAPVGSWQIEVTYTNLNGCTGVSTDTIHVLETPDAPVPQDAAYCEGEEIYLFGTGATPDSMYWYNDVNLTNLVGVGSPTYWGIAPDPANGPYRVYVTQNNWECVSPSVMFELPIKESPVAEFTMTYQDSSGTDQFNIPHINSPINGLTPLKVLFNGTNVSATDSVIWNYRWDIQPVEQKYENTNNENPSTYTYTDANIDENGNVVDDIFVAQMIIINEFGCKDTAQALIWSKASEEFYNVFTPNGDGVNDVFVLPVFGINDYHVEIYNRWGKKVYEWNDPTEGWTGENQPDGVYYYVLTGTRANGTEYKKQGSVTLTGSGAN